MTHDEIKYRALEYCNQKAEKGSSFNPLTVNDLVKFAELCSESANGLSPKEQAEISVMTREEQIDEIVKHLAGLYEHAENRDYRYSISALLRMAIAWADENPVEKNDGILVMRCSNLTKEQIEEFQKHKGILTICKPTKQDYVTEFLQRTECLSCSLFTNCKKRWDKNCEDYKPEEIIEIQDL